MDPGHPPAPPPAAAPPQEAARPGRSRLRILDRLHRSTAPLGLQELADAAQLHPNTVRFHLDRLLAEGLVTRQTEARTGPGRPRVTFVATARPDLDPRRRSYRVLAEMLAGFLAARVPGAAAQAREIGRAWGARSVAGAGTSPATAERPAIAELLRVLDDAGFAPVRGTGGVADGAAGDGAAGDEAGGGEAAGGEAAGEGGHRIVLRHCPFLEVAEEYPEVACSIHHGLLQGVLAQLRAPLVADLRPFAVPGGCLASVRRSSADAG